MVKYQEESHSNKDPLDKQQYKQQKRNEIQKQKRTKKRNKLLQQKDKNELKNCSICMDSIYKSSFVYVHKCKQRYHKKCFKQYIKYNLNLRNFPLKCPCEQCKRQLTQQEIKKVLGEFYKLLFEKVSLEHFVMQNPQEVKFCLTPECEFIFSLEEGVESYECQNCQKQYCFKCEVPYHKNMSCEEYQNLIKSSDQNEQLFYSAAFLSNYAKCPKCHIWVSKIDGCNSIMCRCRHFFCYRCGKSQQKCKC